MSRKKRVLFHSNYAGVKTGFALAVKHLLTYLHKTGKYELGLLASGITDSNPDFARFPWRTFGTLPPNQAELDRLNKDPHAMRMASYGKDAIENVVRDFKPDIYIGVEDLWGLSYGLEMPFWNKIHCIIWWTIDSCPVLPEAVEKAHKIQHHYVWSPFGVREFQKLAIEAEKQVREQKKAFFSRQWKSSEEFQSEQKRFADFEKQCQERIDGFRRVKCIRGPVDCDSYFPLSSTEKKRLRQHFNIPEDTFVIGMLSRNQLRKLYPNALEGIKIFKERNPGVKVKFLPYCSWSEGWDLRRLITELKIPQDEVLACYKCKETQEWFLLPFQGEDIDNPRTGYKKSLCTVNVNHGISNTELNKWFGLLDCFVLPITSGGQEIPCQEAKLCGIPTLINGHTCFEGMETEEFGSLPLDFSLYREIGTNFQKATVYPASIAKQLQKVWNMSPEKRAELGKRGREFVLKEFSIQIIGKQFEELFDSLPEVNCNFEDEVATELKDPNAVIPEVSDDIGFVKTLYDKILKCKNMPDTDEGVVYWVESLKRGMPRDNVVKFFREVATSDNQKIVSKQKQTTVEDLLDQTGRKRLLVAMKESAGDLIYLTCLLPRLKELYPEFDIYLACDPQFAEIFEGNEFLHKVIPWHPNMDSEIMMTGWSKNKGPFDVWVNPAAGAQRYLNYVSRDRIGLATT